MDNSDPGILDMLWGNEVDFDSWSKEFLDFKYFEDPEFDPEVVLRRVPRTDIIASRAIQYKIGNRLSFVSATKTWYAWDGRIHVPTDGDYIAKTLVYRLFDAMVAALREVADYYEREASRYRGSQEASDKSKLEAIKEKIRKLNNYERYRDDLGVNRGTASLVKALETTFHKDSDYFDHDEDYFVVRNGVFLTKEFNDGGWPELRNHSPDRPVSKYFDADWDPSCHDTINDSVFMKFLYSSVQDGNEEIIEYLQKTKGAAFLGRNKLRTIINLMGPPSSGKSIELETFFKLGKEGAGYCTMPNSISITRQPQNWEQSRFRGRRIIGVSEPDTGKEVDDDFLKRFTGDIWVETRNLREKSHGWSPQGILFIASNDYLKINTRDKAIVDRVQIIHFPYQFVPNPDPNNPMQKLRDPMLTEKLQTEEERSHILFWIIDGMRKFHLDGEQLIVPDVIRETSDKVVTEGSAATRWLNSAIEEGVVIREKAEQPYHYITLNDAWQKFSLWNAMDNEHSRLSKTYFENDISQWYKVEKHGANKYIIGIREVNQTYRENNKTNVYERSSV